MRAAIPSLAVVIPCYNEASRLDMEAFKRFSDRYLFLFVNDGSTDETSKVIQRYDTAWYSRFRYITKYTANDDIDTITYSVTNPNTGVWGENERTFYTYDANFNHVILQNTDR